jgi:hypothetical protein
MRNGVLHLATATALTVALSASSAYAQKKYDTGATDTEIKIGPDQSVQRPGFRLCHHRQNPGRLYEDDQRSGWRERPQDQFDPV